MTWLASVRRGWYRKWLMTAMCLWPLLVNAHWHTSLHQLETTLHRYKSQVLLAIQSEALWYYAWQVEAVQFPELMESLHAYLTDFDLLFVQQQDMEWAQSAVLDPCALRLRKVDEFSAFLSLRCVRSQLPVQKPVLEHPALQLLWAWEERLGDSGIVQHQWYSMSKEVEAPQLFIFTLLSTEFPTLPMHLDQYALSFQKEAEHWLLTWVRLGEQVGIYVMRWQ